MANPNRIPHKFLPWIEARKKHRLSHAHIQMARELGMNPKKFVSSVKKSDQSWKAPLPEFIENLYLKQFGRERPETVRSIEQMAADHLAKRAAAKLRRSNPAAPTPPLQPRSGSRQGSVHETPRRSNPVADPARVPSTKHHAFPTP